MGQGMGLKPKSGSNRSVFEEVQSGQRTPVAQPGAIDRGKVDSRPLIRRWLQLLFVLVALIIAVGGMTRLTDSGLSITEWAPISGAFPPSSAADWDAAFLAYQDTTEFKEQNAAMTLAEFKYIFWWEWGHRQLGRIIGAVWAIGFMGLWITGRIPRGWPVPLLSIGVLIGIQGAVGWWMVHSGLQEGMFDVASYRLATHLGLAFVILGILTWYILTMGRKETELIQARRLSEPRLFAGGTGLMHLAFLQILLGALVAGIDAGRAFPTWPGMGGGFLPPEPFGLTPIWRNFFEDAGLVQFVHRMTGYALALYAVLVWRRSRRSPNGHTRFAFNAMLAMMALQVVIGIATVLYSAPLQIAIVHQLGAVLLWVLILRGRFLSRYPLAQSVRG